MYTVKYVYVTKARLKCSIYRFEKRAVSRKRKYRFIVHEKKK